MFNLFKSTQKISAKEAQDLIQSRQATLIDVRTKQEYREGHVSQSINIPLQELASRIESKYPDKTTNLIVMCYSGARSKEAYFVLKNLGYTQVSDLGGIISWPYPIIA